MSRGCCGQAERPPSRAGTGPRRGVGRGSLTVHPGGFAHGPHPGRYEASIGASRTDELAVMLDCNAPLQPTAFAIEIEDRAYEGSLESRKASVVQSGRYLKQFMP